MGSLIQKKNVYLKLFTILDMLVSSPFWIFDLKSCIGIYFV